MAGAKAILNPCRGSSPAQGEELHGKGERNFHLPLVDTVRRGKNECCLLKHLKAMSSGFAKNKTTPGLGSASRHQSANRSERML